MATDIRLLRSEVDRLSSLVSQLSVRTVRLLALSAFGRHYAYAEDLAESTNTSSTFQQKLRLTTPDLKGAGHNRYLLQWSFTYFNTTEEGGDIEVRIEQDDTTQLWNMVWDHTWEDDSSDSGNRWPAAGAIEVTLPRGVYTFDMDFRNPSSGTALISQATMTFWRVV